MGDPPAKPGAGGVLVVEMDGVAIAAGLGEMFQSGVGDHELPLGVLPHLDAHMKIPPLTLRLLPVM